MRLVITLLLSYLCFFSFGQQRTCATMEMLAQQLQENPSLLQQMQQIEEHNHHYHQQLSQEVGFRNVITIPVVFHIIHNGDPLGTNENLSETYILAQLAQLNDDFRKLNSDASLVPPLFQGLHADTEIQFCLAQRRPDGTPTNGINRVQYSQASWTISQINSTVKPATIWDRNQYLNIWTVVFGGSSSNLLGYAQFPGGSANTDGVVVAWYTVGSLATPHPNGGNYARGRTLTHEVGHWLNLRHIWGDANCGNDLVDDTPVHQNSNNGCPTFPKTNNCAGGPWTEMTMNYMDYTFDQCMHMFTTGQKNRMRAVLAPGGARASLLNSLGCVPPGCVAPTVAQLSTSNITSTSARLNCSLSGVNEYNWRYRQTGTSPWTNLPATTANFIDITSLSASTTYEFQVQVRCGETWTAWSASQTFTTTACAAPATIQLAATSITSITAKLNCTVTGVAAYDWRYRQTGASSWTDLPATTQNFINISGLLPGTTYEFQSMVQCGATWSAWSASQTFTTLGGTCSQPSGWLIQVSNITDVSALFTYQNATLAGYRWRYKVTASTNWTQTPNQTTNVYTATGLITNTAYEVQVSVLCSNGAWSNWSFSVRFSTEETSGNCNAPTAAQIFASDLTTTSAQLNCTLTGVSAYFWRFRQQGASTWIDLPSSSTGTTILSGLSAATTYEFQVAVQCSNGVISDWSDAQSFSTLASCPAPSASQLFVDNITSTSAQLNCTLASANAYRWRYRIASNNAWIELGTTATGQFNLGGLSPSSTYEYQAGVQCGSTWSDWSVILNFTTAAASPCPAPTTTEIFASEVTSNSARLNCTVSEAMAYHWRYRVASSGASWTVLPITITNYTDLAGLSALTQYEFQVAIQCATGLSDWSASQFFNTLGNTCNPPVPGQYFVSNLTPTSARFNTTVTSSAYHWRYKPALSDTWIVLPSTTSNFTDVTGLLPGTSYELQVAISCGSSISPWSLSQRFFTPSTTRKGLSSALSVQLWPVPAQRILYTGIQVLYDGEATLRVVSAEGKVWHTQRLGWLIAGAHVQEVDVTELPTGLYMLHVQQGKEIAIEKFVKFAD